MLCNSQRNVPTESLEIVSMKAEISLGEVAMQYSV